MTTAKLEHGGVYVEVTHSSLCSLQLHGFELIHSTEYDSPVILFQRNQDEIFENLEHKSKNRPIEGVPEILPGEKVTVFLDNPEGGPPRTIYDYP